MLATWISDRSRDQQRVQRACMRWKTASQADCRCSLVQLATVCLSLTRGSLQSAADNMLRHLHLPICKLDTAGEMHTRHSRQHLGVQGALHILERALRVKVNEQRLQARILLLTLQLVAACLIESSSLKVRCTARAPGCARCRARPGMCGWLSAAALSCSARAGRSLQHQAFV